MSVVRYCIIQDEPELEVSEYMNFAEQECLNGLNSESSGNLRFLTKWVYLQLDAALSLN